MKSLMSFMFVMPMILTAVSSQAAPAAVNDMTPGFGYHPRYCPPGTDRVFNEYKGVYVCAPIEDHSPRPAICPKGMRWIHGICEYIDGREGGWGDWRDERMKKMSGILGGDDAAAKSSALNDFFDSSLAGASDAGAVAAGSWGATSADLGRLQPYQPKKGASGLVLVGEKGAAAGAIAGGAAGEMTGVPGAGSFGAGVGGLAGSKAEDVFNKKIDELGDRLRSRNDQKLKEGTEAQKKAEEKWPKK